MPNSTDYHDPSNAGEPPLDPRDPNIKLVHEVHKLWWEIQHLKRPLWKTPTGLVAIVGALSFFATSAFNATQYCSLQVQKNNAETRAATAESLRVKAEADRNAAIKEKADAEQARTSALAELETIRTVRQKLEADLTESKAQQAALASRLTSLEVQLQQSGGSVGTADIASILRDSKNASAQLETSLKGAQDKIAAVQVRIQKPRAYIHLPSVDCRELAESLRQRLEARGFATPEIDMVGENRSPRESSVRYSTETQGNEAEAQDISALISDVFVNSKPKVDALRSNEGLRPRHYEIWLSVADCVETSIGSNSVSPSVSTP